jgi:hypothetical protein
MAAKSASSRAIREMKIAASRTDHPTVIVTIFTKAQTKRVEDYHGCFETVEHEVLPPIARLRSFEVEIDSVLRSSRWVRPANRR